MFKVRSRKPVPGKVANTEICRAVSERRVVRCVYDGGEERVIEPHCHGHGKAGEEVLSAFQVGAGWRMFEVRRLGAFELTEARFEVRPDFNAERPGMSQVHCVVRGGG